ncbi:MAG: epoxyqueuosine reductase QueH [Candidatus Aenigmarchaeota archaeon]|nr:epoxyqueuosine reductase QueH [Candidatus Aenigmarchaeota archaeon]
MKLLLHCCCAPCTAPLVENLLKKQLFQREQLVLYYFNPNIQPIEEYQQRLDSMKQIADFYQLALIIPDYQSEKWFKEIQQSLPRPPVSYLENSERCSVCFQIRLRSTVQYAQQHHFDYFSSTLSVSLYKNVSVIKQIGQELTKQYKINFYQFSVNPQDAKQRSIVLSHQLGLHRQKYCGCLFSLSKKNKVR